MVEAQVGNGAPHCPHVSFGNCGECGKPQTKEQREIAELKDKLAAMEKFLNVQHRQDAAPTTGPIKLDLGCGTMVRRSEMKNWTRELGWTGVDIEASDGADVVCDLGMQKWPWEESSVDETNCAHMLEHIPAKDVEWSLADGKLTKHVTWPRAHFMNELWRVLKPGAKAAFVTPYWASCRAYGDITHEWPPVGEMFWLYLDKGWRAQNAPHDSMYSCDFTHGLGYAPGQHLVGRTPEFVNEAIRDHKEAAGDMLATLVARK